MSPTLRGRLTHWYTRVARTTGATLRRARIRAVLRHGDRKEPREPPSITLGPLGALPDLGRIPSVYSPSRLQLVTLQLDRDRALGAREPIPTANPADACALGAALYRALFLDPEQEHFLILLCDGRSRVFGFKHVASGTRGRIDVDPCLVYRSALLLGATTIVALHNHPGGDPTPSHLDKWLTRQLIRAGGAIGIPLVDHLIHTEDQGCVSVRAYWPQLWTP